MTSASSQNYFAIIGDMVHSRTLPDRQQAQQIVQQALDTVNRSYADDLAADFSLTLGDEFQGLLTRGYPIVPILMTIEAMVYPIRLRFGIGFGSITAGPINRAVPLGADGPAYYSARESIDCLKADSKRTKAPHSHIRLQSGGALSDALVNTVFSLCAALQYKWTTRQWEIISDCILHGDNQSQAAKRLQIRQSSVQKSLAGAGYYTYKNAMNTIRQTLSTIEGNRNV